MDQTAGPTHQDEPQTKRFLETSSEVLRRKMAEEVGKLRLLVKSPTRDKGYLECVVRMRLLIEVFTEVKFEKSPTLDTLDSCRDRIKEFVQLLESDPRFAQREAETLTLDELLARIPT